MLLQYCALGVTRSWDEGLLGARASRPHQAWHSLGHLPYLDQPGTAPWLCFGLADAVPAHRVAACSIALKLSGGPRDRMRAGRPRSQAMPSRLIVTYGVRCLPPSGSTAGSALSPTPPQGGSDLERLMQASGITPPSRGSRRSRAARRRLMRWGGDAGPSVCDVGSAKHHPLTTNHSSGKR